MHIILHIDTRKLDIDYEMAINEYFKRTSAFANISKRLYKDFSKPELKKSSYKFIVIQGKNSPTSYELAQKIDNISLAGYSCIEFLITEKSLNLSDNDFEFFNLTSMNIGIEPTVTALAEQIYRAYTINNNIIYHK